MSINTALAALDNAAAAFTDWPRELRDLATAAERLRNRAALLAMFVTDDGAEFADAEANARRAGFKLRRFADRESGALLEVTDPEGGIWRFKVPA